MFTAALLASALTACPQAPAIQEQQVSTQALTTPRDIMLHGIIAGLTFQSNQGFTLQNNSSVHANTGLILNSRNIVLNGGVVSSTNAASCADNSGMGFCLNGKPKFISAIVTVPKPDITALKTKYTAIPTSTIQGSLTLNSSSDITNRFDNKIVLVKGSLNLNTIATIKNATLIVQETINSNKGLTLENTRIIAKGAGFNQTTVLNNSRIITDEDLTLNGKLESTGLSSLITAKNLTSNNNGMQSLSGELAVIAGQNMTLNQSSSGKMALWATSNITINQSSNLEGSVVAGGKVTLNQSTTIAKVSSHLNSDVLGGGQLPFGTRAVGILSPNSSFSTPWGVNIVAPQNSIEKPVEVYVESIDPAKLELALPAEFEAIGPYLKIGTTSEKVVSITDVLLNFDFPIPASFVSDKTLRVAAFVPTYLTSSHFDKSVWTTRREDLVAGYISRATTLLANPNGIFVLVRRKQTSIATLNRLSLQQVENFQGIPIYLNENDIVFGCNTTGLDCPEAVSNTYQNILIRKLKNIIFDFEMTIKPILRANHELVFYGSEQCTGDTLAYYNADDGQVVICVNTSWTITANLNIDDVIKHELTHAVQRRWVEPDNVLRPKRAWIMEGTAVAAEKSSRTSMQRTTDRSLHQVDILLNASSRETDQAYRAQDFWVFAGNWLGVGLPYLKNVFKTGLTQPINNANTGLIAAGFPNGLERAYYYWAKNQAFEKNPQYGMFNAPCTIEINNTIIDDYASRKADIDVSTNFGVANLWKDEPIYSLQTRAATIRFLNPNKKRRIYKLQVITDSAALKDTWYQSPPLRNKCNNNPGDAFVTNVKDGMEYTAVVSSTQQWNRLDTSAVPPDKFTIRVTSVTPAISVPSSISLSGTVGQTTNTEILSIKNTGDVDSTLEFKRYYVTENIIDSSLLNPNNPLGNANAGNNNASAALRLQNVIVPPTPESRLIRDYRFTIPTSEDSLTVTQANKDSNNYPSNNTSVQYFCSNSGNFTRYINIVYSTGATDDNGVAILESTSVAVNVQCRTLNAYLDVISSPIKETIEGYTDETGKFVYAKRLATSTIKNKSAQSLKYTAKSKSPFGNVIVEDREVPANGRDFVDMLLDCPNGPGDYSTSTELLSTDAVPTVYAEVPVDLKCKETPKPVLTPEETNRPAIGGVQSDPHMYSFDGTHFEAQKAGEFILAKSLLSDGFELQARFVDVQDSQVWSATTAIAMRLNGYRIGIYFKSGQWFFKVNGQSVQVNGLYDVGTGIKLSLNGSTVSLTTSTGYAIKLGNYGTAIDTLEVMIPPSTRGQIRGLLGDANGNGLDDFRLRNGTLIRSPIDFSKLNNFLEAWRISDAESLFDYENSESNTNFNDLSFPRDRKYYSMFGITALSAEDRALAEKACKTAKIITPEIFRNCVFDIGLTKDEIWAIVAEKFDPANKFVVITPKDIVLQQGKSINLQAFASHDKAVAALDWTLTGTGSLIPQGDGVQKFVAPTTPTAVTVRASLRDDPTIFDEISISVQPRIYNQVIWSPNGQKLAASGEKTWVFDAGTQQELTSLDVGSQVMLNWNPDNTQLWAGNAAIWNVVSGSTREINFGLVFDWSPDGQQIVTSDATDFTVVRDANSGQILRRISNQPATKVAWSDNGHKVAYVTVNTKQLEVYDLLENKVIYNKGNSNEVILDFSWAADSQTLAFGLTQDNYYGTFCIINITNQNNARCASAQVKYKSIEWSMDQQNIAVIETQIFNAGITTRILRTADLSTKFEISGAANDLSWHPNNPWLAIASSRGIRVWNVETQQVEFSMY